MMNKEQYQGLGLDKLFKEIETPSAFIDTVMRQKLYHQKLKAEEIEEAYLRRKAFIKLLKEEKTKRWQGILSHISGIRASVYHNTILSTPELFELKSFVYYYQMLKKELESSKLKSYYTAPDLRELFKLLDKDNSQSAAFRLSPAYSEALSELDEKRLHFAQKLQYQRGMLLKEAKEKLGRATLKDEFIISRVQTEFIKEINDSGYFVQNRESISNLGFILKDSQLTNSLKAEIAAVNKEIEAEEEKVLEYLSGEVCSYYPQLKEAIHLVKELGWDYSLALFAIKHHCCIPKVSEKIALKGARNLALELSLKEKKQKYQKLDLNFDAKTNLITGPNMGGKSTILRSLGQFACLMRLAMPIPADKASMPLFDYVYYNHLQEEENLSSFGAEIVSFGRALKEEGRGLYLLDEFGKGTNPFEGEALAAAVIGYLAKSEHHCLAATHFSLSHLGEGVRHYQIKGLDKALGQIKEEKLEERLKALSNLIDYSLISIEGEKTAPKDAIKIAEILGLPKEILQEAKFRLS